jgi:Transposase DDE domain
MIERTQDRFDLWPERLIADTEYGSAEMLLWLVEERGIEPHIPVFDKSKRADGTFSREDFAYDLASDTYRCPGGKLLQHYRRQFTTPRTGVSKDNLVRYRASMHDCAPCPLKPRCCPNAPARKVLRSIYEGARDLASDIAKTHAYQISRCQRKKVEMLFAHLKHVMNLDRLQLRGPCGARDEFHLAAIAQDLRKLAKLRPLPGPVAEG